MGKNRDDSDIGVCVYSIVFLNNLIVNRINQKFFVNIKIQSDFEFQIFIL